MIILDRGEDTTIPDTGELLEFLLGGASVSPLPFIVSAIELDDVNREFIPLNQHGVSNGATPVTILDQPSDTELSRQLKALSIYNPNVANTTVTVRFNDNAVTRIIIVTTLEQFDTLQYNDGEGFRVIDGNGNLKLITSAAPAETFVIDQTNPGAASLTDAYVVPAGFKFEFKATVINRSATPTAYRLSIAIAGAADSNEQYIAFDVPIAGNGIYQSSSYKINATDVIRVYATLATLSFTITGTLYA
jgi:hypothetical protein